MAFAMKRLAAIFLLFVFATDARAAPSAELWARWTAHDPESKIKVDHSGWAAFLARHVSPGADGINRVSYAKADRGGLDAYVRSLEAVAVSALARPEQLAFWINLYNALTVGVVLDHFPVEGVRDIDISPGLFSDGPWGAKLATVEGEAVSLDDIEHRILRPIWKDPRIHYAVNCASLGCPNLRPEPFSGENIDAMLESAARAYVNHPRGARFDEDGGLVVSSIYHWFAEDFGGEKGVIAHLKRFAAPGLLERLSGAHEIADHEYDWSLNGR